MSEYAFGIDVGGTTVKIGLFDTEGSLIEKWEIPTRKDEGGSLILSDIASSLRAKLTERSIQFSEVKGAGIGVPGPVLENGTVNKCVNLGWGVFNVQDELSRLLEDMPVVAANDANVAALGEMWQGGGRGYKNVFMVTLGTGVGGGVIQDGRIVYGAFGAGGEIGHIKVSDTVTAVCNCGKTGCLEQFASATGIVRMAQEALNDTDKPSALRSIQYLSAKEVFDKAKAGDELAGDIVEAMGDKLGLALSYVSGVTDPQVFVIGGGVSKAGQILIDAIRDSFRKCVFHASRGAKFALATLGNDAGMYGAVKMIIG